MEHKQMEVAPVFFRCHEADKRFVVSMGGAGSGKSYAMTQLLTMRMFSHTEKLLAMRKVDRTLKDSVVALFETVLKNMGLYHMVEHNKSTGSMMFPNGSVILFKGLDDPEKIKSIAGVTVIWLEEATEFTQADFDQLNLRLRGADGLQMYLTLNPIDEGHWIKKRFFDDPCEDTITIHSTYKDNPFLDEAYIKALRRYRKTNYNYYRVYALGEWGKLNLGGEFYKNFDTERHIIERGYDDSLPLHLSFDENVHPYITCVVWQARDMEAWQVDEVLMRSPQNSLSHLLTEIKKRYRSHREGIFVYGDATSRKADAKLERGHNFYTIIQASLQDLHPKMRVPNSNPSVVMRGMFLNEIWGGGIEGLSVQVNAACKLSIEDYKYLKEAADGTKLKEMARDETTKVSFQKYGHTSDASDYFLCEFFRRQFEEFCRGGKRTHVPQSSWQPKRQRY